MKHKSFAGKSIPVNFSMMSVRDLRTALEIIEEKFSEVRKTGGETIKGDNAGDITVPLRHLAEAFHVNYTVSIEFSKIKEALKKIRIQVESLVKFEKAFFERIKEENRGVDRNKKRQQRRSVPLRIAAGAGWPSSSDL